MGSPTSINRHIQKTTRGESLLIHHSVIIELNIPSYRLEEAKKNNPKQLLQTMDQPLGRAVFQRAF